MDNALSPREIQTRIREGASAAEVAEEAGMPRERVDAFAGPVLAEREHIASQARNATVRRRGEAGSHRRLGDLIAMRLNARGLSTDAVTWDSWRQQDLKWRVVARIDLEPEPRTGEFVYDPKGRFSVALNADARWLIGEEQVNAKPEDENTVDFDDELALVRATKEEPSESVPGDDVPASDLMLEGNEDTSQLDRLYDMLSGISEDSVRIYTGLFPSEEVEEVDDRSEPFASDVTSATDVVESPGDSASFRRPEPSLLPEPAEDSSAQPQRKKSKARKGRAQVPSWDEIMFGGPSN